jgi:hypothetical protein
MLVVNLLLDKKVESIGLNAINLRKKPYNWYLSQS